MRLLSIVACVVSVFVAGGCFPYYGKADGGSTVTYTRDDGIHPVQRTTVATDYRGRQYGLGGGPIGVYAPGGAFPGAACDGLHPEYCAQTVVAYVYRPAEPMFAPVSTIMPVPAAKPAAPAPAPDPVASEKLSVLLDKHEKAIAILAGQHRQTDLQTCRLILASPKSVEDPDERKELVEYCKELIKEHAGKRAAKAPAPAAAEQPSTEDGKKGK